MSDDNVETIKDEEQAKLDAAKRRMEQASGSGSHGAPKIDPGKAKKFVEGFSE